MKTLKVDLENGKSFEVPVVENRQGMVALPDPVDVSATGKAIQFKTVKGSFWLPLSQLKGQGWIEIEGMQLYAPYWLCQKNNIFTKLAA